MTFDETKKLKKGDIISLNSQEAKEFGIDDLAAFISLSNDWGRLIVGTIIHRYKPQYRLQYFGIEYIERLITTPDKICVNCLMKSTCVVEKHIVTCYYQQKEMNNEICNYN